MRGWISFLPQPGLWQRRHAWFGALFSGLLIAIGYGYALRLPFFFDDLPVLTWLGSRDLVDIWTTASENAYYRPLTFTVYKFGQLFQPGMQQVVLHALSLLFYWTNAVLVGCVIKLLSRDPDQPVKAILGSVLIAVFPFMYRAVPWVTAMPHCLVVMLTLLAAYGCLRAERDQRHGWWALGLASVALAPFAHESGLVCAAIVGGLVFIQYGITSSWRRVAYVAVGGLLNVGALWLRSRLPGTSAFDPDGLNSWFANLMFFLHGLVYPVGTAIGWLVRCQGCHDFTLVQIATALLGALLAWLGVRDRNWRWIARALWWWLWGSLPAGITFQYLGLINSPRFYALASVGIVLMWSEVIVALGKVVRPAWGRQLVWGGLLATIVVPNLSYLRTERQVYLELSHVYEQILDVARYEQTAPLGFVNIPAWLAPKEQTYALSKDGVIFLPLYTNVWEFIGVNLGPRDVRNVMFVHTLQEPEDRYWGFHGDWLDWQQMRQFAIDRGTVWTTRYENGRFELLCAGSIRAGEPVAEEPLVRFEDGPVIERVSVQQQEDGHWTLNLSWWASGPVDDNIFVHVVDQHGAIVTQADGAALAGMVPMGLWQAGDHIEDVRHIHLPREDGPNTVLVGVYDANARLPATMGNVHCPDDAAPVAVIGP